MGSIVIVLIVILIACLFIGTPVSTALGMVACLGIVIFMPGHVGDQLLQFGRVGYNQGTSLNQMVAPLFILMSEFLAKGNIAEDIFELLNRILKKLKGGLALSTTLACTIFAALCGSSPATAASVGKISIFSMIKRGYAPSFATGTVVAGGTLGIMIPPSITFVLYGIITDTSIAKLLMAGLLPGLMLSALLCISIIIRVRFSPNLLDASGREEEVAREVIARAGMDDVILSNNNDKKVGVASVAIPAIVIILLVIGSMYTGLATPTEAAGVGAVASLITVVLQRRVNKKMFREALRSSVKTSCMIMFMVIMGMTLSYVVSYLGLAQTMSSAIIGSGASPWAVMIMLIVLWFILGCLMDPGSMIILTMPFIGTTLFDLGFDPIWVGVISVLCVEIGMITPPIGLNLFVVKSVSDLPIGSIIKGSLPYVVVLLIGLVLLCVFPDIALFLPSRM